MVVKLSNEQKQLVRTGLIGLQKSYQRTVSKYSQEGKTEMVSLVQKELGKVASVLFVVDEL